MRFVWIALHLLFLTLVASPAAAAGLAFVINSGGASISLVDMSSQKELRRIPVLREPHHLALSPDGRSLLVGDTVGNEVLFLDPATGGAAEAHAGGRSVPVGVQPERQVPGRERPRAQPGRCLRRRRHAVAEALPDRLDAEPSRLSRRIPRAVFVSLQGTDSLVAIDLNKLAILWTAKIGKTPAGVLWHDGRVLVADMGTDYVAVVDPADGHVTGRIHTGKGAHNLFLSPDRKIIWVNNRVGGTTTSLDAATLTPIRSYAIPGGPDDIAFAPDGRLWITRRWAEKVAVLDPATGEYQTIEVGRSPHGLFLSPKGSASPSVAAR